MIFYFSYEKTHQVAFAEFQSSLRQFEDIVSDTVLIRSVFNVDVTLGDAFDMDVAFLVHAHFSAFANLSLGLFGPVVAHRVVKTVQSNPIVTTRQISK